MSLLDNSSLKYRNKKALAFNVNNIFIWGKQNHSSENSRADTSRISFRGIAVFFPKAYPMHLFFISKVSGINSFPRVPEINTKNKILSNKGQIIQEHGTAVSPLIVRFLSLISKITSNVAPKAY